MLAQGSNASSARLLKGGFTRTITSALLSGVSSFEDEYGSGTELPWRAAERQQQQRSRGGKCYNLQGTCTDSWMCFAYSVSITSMHPAARKAAMTPLFTCPGLLPPACAAPAVLRHPLLSSVPPRTAAGMCELWGHQDADVADQHRRPEDAVQRLRRAPAPRAEEGARQPGAAGQHGGGRRSSCLCGRRLAHLAPQPLLLRPRRPGGLSCQLCILLHAPAADASGPATDPAAEDSRVCMHARFSKA